jgi:adenosine deaminase
MREKFIRALENNNLDELKKIPKSDLHSHGARGGNVRYIEEWAKVKIPRLNYKFKDLAEMQTWYTDNVKVHCPGTLGYEKRIEAAFVQAKEDGVKLLSMSIGFDESSFYNNSIDLWLNSIKEIHSNTAPEVNFMPEMAFNRGMSCDLAIEQLEIMAQYNYFKSIDLHGNEFAASITDYKRLYRKAKEKGLILKAHVGEFGDAESVRQAVEELELNQVQHGISAAASKEVMKFLAHNKIQLNVCPTSNVLLNRVEDYSVHPIRVLFDNGVKVTINTDDMIIFNQSVSEEYLNLYKAGIFKPEELNIIRENSLETIY